MVMDFFETTSNTARKLNQNELQLFEYVVKNMEKVQQLSIREFAEEQFLSTASIFRFTQKLGFSGYSQFIESLIVTTHSKQNISIPSAVLGIGYSEAYLANAMEAVRVMSQKQVEDVIAILNRKPGIYILTDNNTHTIGQYCERLFIGLDFHAYFPETAYQMQNLVNRITSKDMILALSYSGNDEILVDFIQRVFLKEHPYLLSITGAENNTLENLSDGNFYIFADKIQVPGMDLTSSVPMLMILEMLVYEYMAKTKQIN